MNDQLSPFESAAEKSRRLYEEAHRRMSGKSDDWVSRRIPGGRTTLWVILAVVLAGLFIWWLIPGKEMPGAMGRRMGGAQPVGVAQAIRGPIDVTRNALGTVTPLATVSVRPQVSGIVTRFSFKEGQMVQAGDVLAEIDARPFEAALAQAQGSLAKDRAQLANARQELVRQRALWAAKATSQSSLDAAVAAAKQYEGVVQADAASVATAQINLGYTKVTSPVAGRAGIRGVDVGNFVSAGQSTAIVTVTQLTPISVLFTVPEDAVHDVVARFTAGEEMKVEAYDRAQVTKLAMGRLSAVDSVVDTTTGTVKMRALFANDDNQLFPNQFVNVRLLINTLQDQVIIPSAAIQRGSSGTFVFVVRNDPNDKTKKTVAMRGVTTGVAQGEQVAITQGLNPGETVVTDGADRLRDGGEVTIPSGQKVTNVSAPAGTGAAGGAMSAEQRAEFRKKMEEACGPDIKKLCGGATGREAFMCLRENSDKLSEACNTMRKQMRRMGRGPGGGSGGGPGGPPPGGP